MSKVNELKLKDWFLTGIKRNLASLNQVFFYCELNIDSFLRENSNTALSVHDQESEHGFESKTAITLVALGEDRLGVRLAH